MKKSKFNLTHLHSTTLDAGYLVPFYLQETLPNDTFKIGMNAFVRATPMLAPLMHEVPFYTQYWYVPYRLLWDDWNNFITGGETGDYVASYPYITAPTGGFSTGSLADYFGLPVGQAGIEVSAMPFRAYNLIWNSRYRDEDLQDEVAVSFDDGSDTVTTTELLSPSWKRDYFTTARSMTQRGNQISVPIGSGTGSVTKYSAKVAQAQDVVVTLATPYSRSSFQLSDRSILYFGRSSFTNVVINPDGSFTAHLQVAIFVNDPDRDVTVYYDTDVSGTLANVTDLPKQDSPYVASFVIPINSNSIDLDASNVTSYTASFAQSIFATSSTNEATLGSFEIRDLRLASATQRYQERSLLWGNRYEEFIQREFGIKPRDSRIQRPEYLGGSKSVLQISEVLQTAEGTDSGVGTMRGHGVASIGQRPIRFTSPEHGLIIGLLSIRPVPVYTQGIPREWLKRSKLDFYTPELANVGMQEVFQQEIYATSANKGSVFGFQDRYQEYRYTAPKVTGEFRTGNYDFWNMARSFSSPPVINDSFINMKYSVDTFKRPFAERTQHSYLVMLRNNVLAYRPIPKRAKNILK